MASKLSFAKIFSNIIKIIGTKYEVVEFSNQILFYWNYCYSPFLGGHLIIFIPEICTHLLDIGLMHEPCCHVTTKPLITNTEIHMLCLAPIIPFDNCSVVNLATLDLIDISVATSLLVETYKSDTLLENKLSILHYLILHAEDIDTASEVSRKNELWS